MPLRLSFCGVELEREREPEAGCDTGGADGASCGRAGADWGTGVRARELDDGCDCGITTSSSSSRTWSRRLLTSGMNDSAPEGSCDCVESWERVRSGSSASSSSSSPNDMKLPMRAV